MRVSGVHLTAVKPSGIRTSHTRRAGHERTAFVRNCGVGVGFTYDSTATGRRDIPIIAGDISIHPARDIKSRLELLQKVGLGYIRLGQAATTLSGGEAQRIKLSKELSKRATGKTVYILDEPTTGLHFEDINKLLKVLQALVDQGNTVIVIEHNLDVIKVADYIIDMGPEGGDGGGRIVAEGTPEEIVKKAKGYTYKYLKGKI